MAILPNHFNGHLTRIINASISQGKFPEIWKCGIVTPVLKKGSPKDKTNYRPVSCLSVLSKVIEKIVCSQITKFMEDNGHLPQNQHGFRAGRSTMTALSAIQQEWAEKAPISIRGAKSISIAKQEIKKFCKQLPI